MTQEDKQLLLVDLCARSPYGVKFKISDYSDYKLIGIVISDECPIKIEVVEKNEVYKIEVTPDLVEPYLRPMSSMTEEEVKEFYDIECMDAKVGYIKPTWNWHFTINGIDWLNAHHFDYRGLIEKGLAIAVSEGNNPYKE